MTNDEKIALKAACMQAAATLIAARGINKGGVESELPECARIAASLYTRVFAVDWRVPEAAIARSASNCSERRKGNRAS